MRISLSKLEVILAVKIDNQVNNKIKLTFLMNPSSNQKKLWGKSNPNSVEIEKV